MHGCDKNVAKIIDQPAFLDAYGNHYFRSIDGFFSSSFCSLATYHFASNAIFHFSGLPSFKIAKKSTRITSKRTFSAICSAEDVQEKDKQARSQEIRLRAGFIFNTYRHFSSHILKSQQL